MEKSLIFYDWNTSIHIDRILKEFRQLGWSAEYRSYSEQLPEREKFLFFGSVDSIPKQLLGASNPKIGISWAYDIYKNSKNVPMTKVLRNSFNQLDLLIVDCEYVARLAEEIGIEFGKLKLLPYGISLADYKYQKNRREHRQPFTIYSNRNWEIGYGQRTLLESLRILLSNQISIILHLSGDGNTRVDILSGYEDLIQKGLVRYHGRVNTDKNLKILRSSDAYVSASEHDGWSVSILESLAVGTPVIVSNIDPNKDLLDSGIHGVLFENRDPVSLCTKIEQLIKESRTTKNVENRRISGRKKIEEFCDLGSNLKNLSHLLESTFLERNS